MSSPEILFQATINRLSARFGNSLAETLKGVSFLLKDAPEKLRDEWNLFQEEVNALSATGALDLIGDEQEFYDRVSYLLEND